jgi:SNF2 family DNA or RNA helicase
MRKQKYEFKTEPFKHQKDVLLKSWFEVNWAYFLEMGTGKSKLAIDNAAFLFECRKIDTLIVLAPKGVYRNWAHLEIPDHLPDRILREMAIWNPSPKKQDREALKNFLAPACLNVHSDALRVLIMNVEALSTVKGQRYLRDVLRASQAMFVLDESTSIKNPKAKRTKALLKLSPLAKYRRILTGFPVTQSPMDLWAQCYFLDNTLLGDCGDNFFQFQYRYAVMKKKTFGAHSFNQVVGYRNLENLSHLLTGFSSRIMKDECLDLPDKIYVVRHVTLTKEQQRIYSEIKQFALACLDEDKFMTAPNAMTQLLRLQQVLSGHTKPDDGSLVEITDNRLPELMSCLEETDGKVIIWSRFRYDMARINKALRKAYGAASTVTYYGDTSDDERTTAIDQFQNGEARFFVGNPQTGGYGITLTAAQTVIYFANSFDLAVRMQSEDRAHRIGQKNNVTYVDLIAEGTIDEKIVKSLRNKMDIASLVMGEELREWLR